MKYAVLLFTLATYALNAEIQENMVQHQSPDTYYTTKAYEAIIHDVYQEAMPYGADLPDAYKNALAQFGFTPEEIPFYTAVRMNNFVEKIGNNIILLRPNFFLYLTPEEQATNIAVQLARIKAGDRSEVAMHIKCQKNLDTIDMVAKTAIAGSLALYYRDSLTKAAHMGFKSGSELLFSKTGILIGACLLATAGAHMLVLHKDIAKLTQYELDVIDAMGPEGLTKIRERQVVWGKHNVSWLHYQWWLLKGRLGLADIAEVQLEKYKKHAAQKAQQ